MTSTPQKRIILASGSASRRQMLSAAGVTFDVVPSSVDEPAVRRRLEALHGALAPMQLAIALASAKAADVSRNHPGALVIGADQVLALGSKIYEKPKDLDEARSQLRSFRGTAHALHSAVTIAAAGREAWSFNDTAHLTMRRFTDAFLEDYVRRAGPVICTSVGAYQLEGLGLQLFEKIDGDYFTILGMPLLPLLTELRNQGALIE